MLEDQAQLNIMSDGPHHGSTKAVKYQLVMRMAERWALEAFREKLQPHDYCEKKFRELKPCGEWGEVTRVIMTAFTIREHQVIKQFLKDDFS